MNVDVINSLVYYRYFRYEFLLSFTLVNWNKVALNIITLTLLIVILCLYTYHLRKRWTKYNWYPIRLQNVE
jgi:hypothetical protein